MHACREERGGRAEIGHSARPQREQTGRIQPSVCTLGVHVARASYPSANCRCGSWGYRLSDAPELPAKQVLELLAELLLQLALLFLELLVHLLANSRLRQLLQIRPHRQVIQASPDRERNVRGLEIRELAARPFRRQLIERRNQTVV